MTDNYTTMLRMRAQHAAGRLGPRSAAARIRSDKIDAVLKRTAGHLFGFERKPSQEEVDAMPDANYEWTLREIMKEAPGLFLTEDEIPKSREELAKMSNAQKHLYGQRQIDRDRSAQ